MINVSDAREKTVAENQACEERATTLYVHWLYSRVLSLYKLEKNH